MLSGQKACLALRRGLNSTNEKAKNEKAKNYYFLVPKEIETKTQHREINWKYGVFWPCLRSENTLRKAKLKSLTVKDVSIT